MAIEFNQTEAFLQLCEHGADIYSFDQDRYQPLALAVYHDRIDICRYLIDQRKVDVVAASKNMPSAYGNLLHITKSVDMAELILSSISFGMLKCCNFFKIY